VAASTMSSDISASYTPKAGRHFTKVTPTLSSPEFADYLLEIAVGYSGADTIHGNGQPIHSHPQGVGRSVPRSGRRLAVVAVYGSLHAQTRQLAESG
jgi:hypothetical protein